MIAIVALQNCGLSQERAYTPQETEQLKQAKEDSQKLIRFYEEGQYERAIKPVSYTHLTLPTIYSV